MFNRDFVPICFNQSSERQISSKNETDENSPKTTSFFFVYANIKPFIVKLRNMIIAITRRFFDFGFVGYMIHTSIFPVDLDLENNRIEQGIKRFAQVQTARPNRGCFTHDNLPDKKSGIDVLVPQRVQRTDIVRYRRNFWLREDVAIG